jgi:hypothetical protein
MTRIPNTTIVLVLPSSKTDTWLTPRVDTLCCVVRSLSLALRLYIFRSEVVHSLDGKINDIIIIVSTGPVVGVM